MTATTTAHAAPLAALAFGDAQPAEVLAALVVTYPEHVDAVRAEIVAYRATRGDNEAQLQAARDALTDQLAADGIPVIAALDIEDAAYVALDRAASLVG